MKLFYRVYNDGRKNMVTIPVWAGFRKGDVVRIIKLSEGVLLIIREGSVPKLSELFRRFAEVVEEHMGVSKQVVAKLIANLYLSYSNFLPGVVYEDILR